MPKYCLSYDVQDSETTDSNDIKRQLVEAIIDAGGTTLENPVATTILFEDDSPGSRIQFWGAIIEIFSSDIFFHICQIGIDRQGNNLESKQGDPKLNQHFRKMLDDLDK